MRRNKTKFTTKKMLNTKYVKTNRPLYKNIFFKNGYMMFTDGYAAFKIPVKHLFDDVTDDELRILEGKYIDNNVISNLKYDDIIFLDDDKYSVIAFGDKVYRTWNTDIDFPDIEGFLTKSPGEPENFKFNLNLLASIAKVLPGDIHLETHITGKNKPIIISNSEFDITAGFAPVRGR